MIRNDRIITGTPVLVFVLVCGKSSHGASSGGSRSHFFSLPLPVPPDRSVIADALYLEFSTTRFADWFKPAAINVQEAGTEAA